MNTHYSRYRQLFEKQAGAELNLVSLTYQDYYKLRSPIRYYILHVMIRKAKVIMVLIKHHQCFLKEHYEQRKA